jgi:hypothetical protein
MRDMTNIEVRMNLFHLVRQVCFFNVEGEIAELGSFTGETAALLGKVCNYYSPNKNLLIYDIFET